MSSKSLGLVLAAITATVLCVMQVSPASAGTSVQPRMAFTPEPSGDDVSQRNDLRISVLRGVENDEGELTWRVVNPSSTVFRTGDRVKFRVTSRRDGYLTIYDQDPNGDRTVLMPHRRVNGGASRITANRAYTVPPAASGGSFQLLSSDEMIVSRGTETLDFYLTSGRRDVDEMDFGGRMEFAEDPSEGEVRTYAQARIRLTVRR